jgi:hypothetical protein
MLVAGDQGQGYLTDQWNRPTTCFYLIMLILKEVNEMPIQFAKYAKYGTADEWNSPQEIEWYGTKNNEPINRV